MIRIESDSPAIEKEVRNLETLIVEEGGGFDPQLIIKCESEDGGLSVMRDGFLKEPKPLITVPDDLLLPVDVMKLCVTGDDFGINADHTMSEAQYKAASYMVELYNLTGKIPFHKQTYPWYKFRAAPDAMELILKERTITDHQKEIMAFTKQEANCTPEAKFLCDTYLKTRVIGHKRVNDETGQKKLTSKLMPVIDFINHDYYAGHFNFFNEDEKEFLCVGNSQPVLDSRECFAFYNQMDAVDAFLHYGFPDARSPIIRSIEMEIDIPKTGKIIVRSTMCPWRKGKVAKHIAGIQTYIPQTMANEDGRMEVSHLLIPCANAPQALRRVLRLMISSMIPHILTPDEIWEATLAAEDQIIMSNTRYYEEMKEQAQQKLQETESSNPEAASCWKDVFNLADLQLTKLHKYTFFQEKKAQQKEDKSPSIAAAE